MTFTDDDLKQIKDWVKNGGVIVDGTCNLESLLARLEAAEDLILHHLITPIGYDKRYKVWRQIRGK